MVFRVWIFSKSMSAMGRRRQVAAKRWTIEFWLVTNRAMIKIIASESDQSLDTAVWMQRWQKFLQKPPAKFLEILQDDDLWQQVLKRAAQIESRRIVILGVGGSSLGTQMLQTALAPSVQRELLYLEVPDPRAWEQIRHKLDGTEHLVLISKSGETLETLAWIERLHSEFPQLFFPSSCTVVASPGQGMLQEWAKTHSIPTLWIPSAVGGRFSVLTAVGLLPAALLGLDLSALRQGARWAGDRPELAAQLAHAAVLSWQRGETITQAWAFAAGLKPFGEWWQQLWSESLGKPLDPARVPVKSASSPMACTGPRDQHSLVQQLLEGIRDKFVYVLRVRELEQDSARFTGRLFSRLPFYGQSISLGQILGAQASAFEKSLAEVKIPYQTLFIDKLDEAHMGALIVLWEMQVALLGEYLHINAFDQPGVELGKRYAKELLSSPK